MQFSNILMNVFAVSSIIVALVTVARFAPLLLSWQFLLGSFILSSVIGFLRWQTLRRKLAPETRGRFSKLSALDFKKTQSHLNDYFVGHATQVRKIFRSLRRNSQLVNKDRHLGSYLIAGPRGAGKTFFARTLALTLFGDEGFCEYELTAATSADQLFENIFQDLKTSPYRVLLFTGLDQTVPETRKEIEHFLETGKLRHPRSQEWMHAPGVAIFATVVCSLSDGTPTSLEDHLMTQAGFSKSTLAKFSGLHYFGPLTPREVIQLSLSELLAEFKGQGLRLDYVSPEILIRLYEDNLAYEGLGVEQLALVTKRFSDPIIAEAKGLGFQSLRLTVDQRGKVFFARSGPRAHRISA